MKRLDSACTFLRVAMTATALCLAVSACSASRTSGEDVDRMLSEMKGPEVPGMRDALLNGAKQADASRNYVRAAQFYKQLVDTYPNETEYRFHYAESLRRSGAYDAAVAAYAELEKDKEYRVAALEGAGLALMAQGDFDDAGDKLADVMEQDTTRWRTINAIGILFTIKQMYPEARQYFAEALVQAPRSVAVRNNMGLMEALDKHYDEAVRLLNEARAIVVRDKTDQQGRMQTDMNLALVYAVKGDLEMAEKSAKPHLTEAQLLNNMGYYAHLADDDQLAKSYLNMALTSSDKHYQKAWRNLETLNKLIHNAPRRR